MWKCGTVASVAWFLFLNWYLFRICVRTVLQAAFLCISRRHNAEEHLSVACSIFGVGLLNLPYWILQSLNLQGGWMTSESNSNILTLHAIVIEFASSWGMCMCVLLATRSTTSTSSCRCGCKTYCTARVPSHNPLLPRFLTTSWRDLGHLRAQQEDLPAT